MGRASFHFTGTFYFTSLSHMLAVYRCVCACQQTLSHLHAVVMGAFSVEVAAVVVDAAVIQGAEAHEAVLQGVVALLVHVVVPDHVLLAGEPLETSEKGEAGQEGRAAGRAAATESTRRHDHDHRCKSQAAAAETTALCGY